jgi:hypothetical protein
LAKVNMPSGETSWMMSSSWIIWAMTRLSGGPGIDIGDVLGPGLPKRGQRGALPVAAPLPDEHLPLGRRF